MLDSVTLEVRPADLDADDATRTGTLSFTLEPGEQIYLYALMDVEAEREMSFADAFSTLQAGFQDSTGLVAASQVPEPATGTLLGLGLLGMALRPERRGRQ